MIRALASIFQKAVEKCSSRQRDDTSAPRPSSPDPCAHDAANEGISEALPQDPQDRVGAELYIVSELQGAEIPRIYAAINLCKKQTGDFTTIPSIRHAFEHAAAHLYLGWLNGQTPDTIRRIVSVTDAIRLAVPQSETIAAIHALAIFELGDLRSAEGEFSPSGTVREVPPLIEELRVNAMQQIADARAINVGKPYRAKLLLLDTAFPSKTSSFRYGEFSVYLEHIASSTFASRPDKNIFRYGETNGLLHQVRTFANEAGIQADRIRRFDVTEIGASKIAYCVFLNAADTFFTQIGIPSAEHLIFTLYPGGGFAMRDQRSDIKLRTLCDNPRVSKIITTQRTTYNYLIDNRFCSSDRIEHIFGVVVPAVYKDPSPEIRKTNTDGAINVCFVAHRYSAVGAEKGYDVFAGVVRALANSPDFEFHIVGDFDREVIDLRDARNVTFHGTKTAEFFPRFYSKMDAIVSPNIQLSEVDPSAPAFFDGFPTTCVVEAGLQGAAMLATDFLGMNRRLDGTWIFSDDELRIIDRDVESIAELLKRYANDREALAKLGEAGKNAIRREFSFDRQMRPRIDLLNSYLCE